MIQIQLMASLKLTIKNTTMKGIEWTTKEIKYLQDNYEDLTRAELAVNLKRTIGAIHSKAGELNITKSKAALKKLAKRPNSGQFNKGQDPHNIEKIGHIAKSVDKRTGRVYLNIKVDNKKGVHSTKNYEELHHVNYRIKHGPIPKGMCVSFKDGDSLNCDPDNLELITMQENIARNSGSLNLPDGMVAQYLSPKDKELKNKILEYPELIEIKRKSIQLNREIHGNNK